MSKRSQLHLLVLLPLALTAACTTVSDFQKMTPGQRAEAVCKRQPTLRNMFEQKQALEAQVADAQAALARGYRVHKQCQQVKVYGNASTSCTSMNGYTNCQESRPESYETRCTETPVSISADLERSNINLWSQSLENLRSQARSYYQNCYQSVLGMSAEEAYKHY